MACKETKYTNVDYSDEDQILFYGALRDSAREFGCHYLSYVCEYPTEGLRFGFTSNPDWQKEYINKQLIDRCHLWKTVSRYFIQTNRPAFILPWETVEANTSEEKDIILYRDEMSVGRNGISFCTQNDLKREFIAFAPGEINPNFTQHITNNIALVRKIANVFRNASVQAKNRFNQIADGANEN